MIKPKCFQDYNSYLEVYVNEYKKNHKNKQIIWKI